MAQAQAGAGPIDDPSLPKTGAPEPETTGKRTGRRAQAQRPAPVAGTQDAPPKPTIVRCFHERIGGSDITIESTMYRFRPNKDGHHICAVTNPKHLKLFLAADHSYVDYSTPIDEQYPVVPGEAKRSKVASGQVAVVDEFVEDDAPIPYEQWTLEQLTDEVKGQFGLKDANTHLMARLGKDMFELDINPNDEPRGIMIQLLEAYDANVGEVGDKDE